jgi:hypothetical protein
MPRGCVPPSQGRLGFPPVDLGAFWGFTCVASVPRGPALPGGVPLLTLPTRSAPCLVQPLGPLAWRPSSRSPLNVIVPNPQQGPGPLAALGADPCLAHGGVGRQLPGLGRSPAPRVVGICRPMPLVQPTAVCPRVNRRLCVRSPPSSQGARGVSASFVFEGPSSRALSLRALAPHPGFPPGPLRLALPPWSPGERGRPCAIRPSSS